MTKENNEDFINSNKCWICEYDYVDNDVKERDHCHITGKYRDSTHKDCNINVKLNHKISAVLGNLKYYDSHLIIHEISKFNLKINVISNTSEKHELYSQ